MTKEYSAGAVRKEIIDAIRAIGTKGALGKSRPVNINFPNDPSTSKTSDLPYMDVYLLSAPTVQPFAGVELRKQQLVQVDFFVKAGVSLDDMDCYVESMERQFHNYRNFGLTRVASPPEITVQGEETRGYRLSMSFTMEYFVQ